MKKSEKELSGRRLHRFFMRFFEAQADVDPAAAERMGGDLAAMLTAVSLRQQGLASVARRRRVRCGDARREEQNPAFAAPPAVEAMKPLAQAAPAATAEVTFNPYAFGLIPIFVREGPDALMQRLNAIHCLDHLRKIARAQQIALPAEFRNGEAAADDVRSAIVAAVRKRIADRRAAAG